jgi:hypothetical protein
MLDKSIIFMFECWVIHCGQLLYIPLKESRNILSKKTREKERFLSDLFRNHEDILRQHERFLQRLLALQASEHPHVKVVGDAILVSVREWSSTIVEYISRVDRAEFVLKREILNNSRLKAFLEVRIIVISGFLSMT